MIIRGTTPVIKGKMPYSLEDLSVLYITFMQDRAVLFEKTKADCYSIDETHFGVRLTQADTLSLKAGRPVSVQARLRTTDDVVAATRIMDGVFCVGEILKDGEI